MNVVNLFVGFAINLLIAVLIVRFIYYPTRQSKNAVFTFMGFSTIIYFIVSFLSVAELGIGVGFGLFAIFSILRYRTSPMPAREMTYLFVLIALSVMSAILMNTADWLLLAAISAVVCTVLMVLEREWGFRYEAVKSIKYERIDLIHAENYAALLNDMRQRTGLNVTRVEIGSINYVNEWAEVKLYFSARLGRDRHFDEDNTIDDDDD